eukprot:TRINITY_DN3997_c0_g1_i1.p1 TRINITY_DN3997_c0_g1~~TRINITY_DN3997_c0_g1_i1.p1  ORF type:complete len:371 (+),score=84.72 TRINITY_DN3997_c0_g1_i1:66-1178(+)
MFGMKEAKPLQDMDETELRARIAEMALEKESQSTKMEDKNMEIDELKKTIKMYADENKKLNLLRRGNGTPRGGSHVLRDELARTQAHNDDLQKANAHFSKSLNAAEKQLTASNVAVVWAHTQLKVVAQEVQALNADLEQVQGTQLRGKKARRSVSPGPHHGEAAQKVLSDLCTLITQTDQGVQALRKRFVTLDIEEKVKELETQLKQWKTKAERQMGEVDKMDIENRELRDRLNNGGFPMPKEESTRIVQPEVIRMPSHAAHSVNSEHWPVRSVACQTPKGDEQWIWSVSGDRSPRAGRSAATSVWDAPPGPGVTPPASPSWNSPSQTYDSPKARRTTSPGRSHKGLVSSAVLRRHIGSRSPFRGSNAYA